MRGDDIVGLSFLAIMLIFLVVAWYVQSYIPGKEVKRRIESLQIGEVYRMTGNPFEAIKVVLVDMRDGYVGYRFMSSSGNLLSGIQSCKDTVFVRIYTEFKQESLTS